MPTSAPSQPPTGLSIKWGTAFSTQDVNLHYGVARARMDQSIDHTQVIFIGQWLSERKLITQDAEVAGLRAVSRQLGSLRAQYVPHRLCSAAKLDRISEFMDIMPLNTSIEDHFLTSDVLPGRVLSWYSTALFMLNRMFPGMHLTAIHVPETFDPPEADIHLNDPNYSPEWTNVYLSLTELGIEVVDVFSD